MMIAGEKDSFDKAVESAQAELFRQRSLPFRNGLDLYDDR